MKRRRRLGSRPPGFSQKATIGGVSIYVHTGEFDDGTLGEVFLRTRRGSSEFQSALNAIAIAMSIGLQHETPLAAYVDAFLFTKWEPSGLVYGVDEIAVATSPTDFLARLLAIHYLGRDDLRVDREALP